MKILLVHPSTYSPDGKLLYGKYAVPHLTLPYLAALCPPNVDIKMVVDAAEEINYDEPFDLVGITSTTRQAPRAFEIATEFRKRGVKVVIGGMHCSALPEETLEFCDAIAIGEAEQVWKQMLSDAENGRLQRIYRSKELHNMAGLPTPRFELYNPSVLITPERPVETARGCPYKCIFCAVTLFYGNRYRFRPIADVIRNIEELNTEQIEFIDDNIVGTPRRAKELFQALTPLKIRWKSQASTILARNPELVRLAAKSGCEYLALGIESLNQDTLNQAKKTVNRVEEFPTLFKLLRDNGITPSPSFILGFDNDTPDDFRRIVDFIIKEKLPVANFYILTPPPTSSFFERLENEGRLFTKDWRHYDGTHIVYKPKNMTPDQLEKEFWKIWRRVYTWSSIIRRVVLSKNPRKKILWRANIRVRKSSFNHIHPFTELVNEELVRETDDPSCRGGIVTHPRVTT